MLRRAAALALLAPALCGGTAVAAPSTSPELVPFTGTRLLTATWGAPSGNYHSYPAIDIALPTGTPIYAAGAGTIVASHSGCPVGNINSTCGIEGLGNMVRIAHPDGRHSRYGHLNSLVRASGNVGAGELIGYSGSSGKSTGPHLHYQETSGASFNAAVDPSVWVACHGAARVDYGGLQSRVGQTVRNDGYGCSAGGDPIGHYDEASSPEAGVVRVRGWAYDPDARTSAAEMHVYLGGQAGQADAEGRVFAANALRPDVGNAFPGVGDNHGLDRAFETGKRGSQPVCVYAITIGGGSNVFLGCKTVAIADPNPVGNYEGVGSEIGGTVRVSGWTYDPNAPAATASVHVYVGGRYGQPGVEGPHTFGASVQRTDVAAVHPAAGAAHGFHQTLTTAKRGSQSVCAYAINSGAGANVLLGCRTATIGEPPPPPPPDLEGTPGETPAEVLPAPPHHPAASAVSALPPTASLPLRVRSGRGLRIVASGLADGSRITVTLKRRGAKAVKRTATVAGGRASVRAPGPRGRYAVRVLFAGRVIASRSLKVI